MATLKLTLDKRREYRDGRSPLIIRLTAKGKSTSIHLGVKLLYSEWDSKKSKVSKSHPNFKDLNLHIKNQLLQLETTLIRVEAENTTIGLIGLKNILVGKDEVMKDFIPFAKTQVSNLKKQNRYGTAQSYQTAINQIEAYRGKAFGFEEVDFAFIKGFESYLLQKGLSVNGVAVYMRSFRALLNIAINLNHYDISLYPFKRFKIRTERTVSRAQTAECIGELIHHVPSTSEQRLAQKVFILIFGLIGISFMDLLLLKKSDLRNGRIIYKRRKTGKVYSIKLLPHIETVFEHYSNIESPYLLPLFGLEGIPESRVRSQVNLALKSTNRYLKQLGELLSFDSPLTTYVARYSWANIAKSNGYSKDLIAEALGHNYGNSVTGIYLDAYGNDVIDDANQKVNSMLLFNE